MIDGQGMTELAYAGLAVPGDWGGVAELRLDLLLRLLLAAVLGGAIGVEREISSKPAGFRTNLLICVGAALLTELSVSVARAADPMAMNGDPGRIAAQIVSGIGFLGAGTIIQARGSVVGLTTAATLWVVAAIGIAVGAHAYIEAVGATALVLAALVFLGRVEGRLFPEDIERTVVVTLEPGPGVITRISETLRKRGVEPSVLEASRSDGVYTASFRLTGRLDRVEAALAELIDRPEVHRISNL